jgi:hypothetical protein
MAAPDPAAGYWAQRVGARYSVTSCDLRILTDQPAEPIPPQNPPTRQEGLWGAEILIHHAATS